MVIRKALNTEMDLDWLGLSPFFDDFLNFFKLIRAFQDGLKQKLN